MSLGIDRSHFQGAPAPSDAQAVKSAGRTFVISKASEGLFLPDVTFPASRAVFKAQGLIFGSYHLGRNTATGEAQWAAFRDYAKPQDDELVALDVEAGWAIDSKRAQAFIDAGRAEGFKVGAYGVLREVKTLDADWYWSAFSLGGDVAQVGTVTIGGITYDSNSTALDLTTLTKGHDDMAAFDDFISGYSDAQDDLIAGKRDPLASHGNKANDKASNVGAQLADMHWLLTEPSSGASLAPHTHQGGETGGVTP